MNNASTDRISNPSTVGPPSLVRGTSPAAVTHRRHVTTAGLVLALALAGACGQRKGPNESTESVGTMALSVMGDDNFAGVQFDVVSVAGGQTDTRFVATRTLAGALSADAFFIVRPGDYTATATVMIGPGVKAPECTAASGDAAVRKGVTTELLLVVRCHSAGVGGLDINGRINHDPEITSVVFDPSKIVSPCQTAQISVTATDADNDPLTYQFQVVDAPAGATYSLSQDGAHATFRSTAAGDFSLAISVCDALGCSDMTVPLHVIASADAPTCTVSCDDGNPCTIDTMVKHGACHHVPANGFSCGDPSACNGQPTCQAGQCMRGAPVVCQPGFACGTDGCHSCDDGNPCTTDTVGNDGACHSIPATDGIACGAASVCNGPASCQAGRCAAGTPVVCDPGLVCGANGCQDPNECENGQNNCSPNATCSNTDPRDDGFAFVCSCNPGYEGDGVTCNPICDPITVATGVERCVRARPNGTVDMRFTSRDPQAFEERYVQNDEPAVNFCGPTAAKNFLFWYGADAPYSTLAGEMHTNTWDTPAVIGALLLFGPAVGCIEPISCGFLGGAISTFIIQAGTLPGDMLRSLNSRAPAGYVACSKDGDNNEDNFRKALAEGNPVVFLESTVGNLHWATATGIYTDVFGHQRVRVANSTDRDWSDFQKDWSLSRVGDPPGVQRGALKLAFGLSPYTMIRWIPQGETIGGHCP